LKIDEEVELALQWSSDARITLPGISVEATIWKYYAMLMFAGVFHVPIEILLVTASENVEVL